MMPQDLSSGVWQQTRSDDQIRSVLARGKNQMPGFGYLSDEDHSSLILFVRSLRVAPRSQEARVTRLWKPIPTCATLNLSPSI